jgi:uncharacterized protein
MLSRLLIGVVKAYRLFASPWLGAACRFEPTCSVYAIGAIEQHGSIKGAGLAAWRIVRCAPWCQGGHDPVPAARTDQPASQPKARAKAAKGLFTRLTAPK